MENPILQRLLNQNQPAQPTNQSMSQDMSGIPSALRNNPKIGEVMNLIRESGGDARSAFFKLAKEKGVDPYSILSMLKQ